MWARLGKTETYRVLSIKQEVLTKALDRNVLIDGFRSFECMSYLHFMKQSEAIGLFTFEQIRFITDMV